MGFYLGLPGEMGDDAAYELRELSRFTYRVLAPAGWGEQVLLSWDSLQQQLQDEGRR